MLLRSTKQVLQNSGNKIPALTNPAYDGSRGVGAQHFHAGCRWWSGPKVLWKPEHTWANVPVEDLQDEDMEVRKSSQT